MGGGYYSPGNDKIRMEQRNDITDQSVGKAMRRLETDSGPTTEQQGIGLMDPEVDALRQRVQSSVWVKQLISGARRCTFSHLTKPKDLLLRMKRKHTTVPGDNPQHQNQGKTRSASIMSVDELQCFSVDTGKSFYLPCTAGGVFAAVTDALSLRWGSDAGWIRPDIVEHISRVLRLRIVSDIHRACCQYVAHTGDRARLGVPLAIPPKGTTFKVTPSRLDVIRMEAVRRTALQDALWQPSAGSFCPFVDLTHEFSDAGSLREISIDRITLPPAGLQCIIEIPPPLPIAAANQASQLLSVSSEASAQAVWAALRRIAAEEEKGNSNMNDHVPESILAEQSWPAYGATGRPQTLHAPTLGIDALESLYALLPRLTPELMRAPQATSSTSPSGAPTKGSRRKHKQALSQAIAEYAKMTQAADFHEQYQQNQRHRISADVAVSFKYSLVRPGMPSTPPDGSATRSIPLYRASSIFGHAVAASVIPWLLHLPLSRADVDASNADPQSPRYVGVVALPCTTLLGAQFDRLATYVTHI
ncbi:hypothetical protein GGI11_002869 [Coemansia sp. RSA 2049]|nr:hypothetical protein GGI11_002869 [Coemansia sp. RSA 2049]